MGRPAGKEHNDPNTANHASLARQYRWDEQSSKESYKQQLHELANAKGRSWGYHECRLILTLILGSAALSSSACAIHSTVLLQSNSTSSAVMSSSPS